MFFGVITALGAAAAASAPSSFDCAPSKRQDVPMTRSVAIVGDSHVSSLEEPLRAFFDECKIKVTGVLSQPGWTTPRYARSEEIQSWVRGLPATDVILVVLGTNDWGIQSEKAYVESVQNVAKAVAAKEASVMWVGAPDVKDARFQEGLRNVASLQRHALTDMEVRWVDSVPHTKELSFPDKVHLDREGYEIWACRLVGEVHQHQSQRVIIIFAVVAFLLAIAGYFIF